MSAEYNEHRIFKCEKLSVFTCRDTETVQAPDLKRYIKKHWRKIFQEKFDQELPDCQFKGNKSKIQKLIKKVHVDANGSVTEIQFDIKENNTPKNPEEKESKNEDPTSLRKKIQKFFGRK